jgi:hypothetical protein
MINNNKNCQICMTSNGTPRSRCKTQACNSKTCNTCHNQVMASGKNEAPCPWCRAPLRTKLETSLARVRRLAAAHAQRSTAPRAMHSGGLIRKTGPHRLLEGEIVLSRSQRQGLTHGQIVKILKSYRSRS